MAQVCSIAFVGIPLGSLRGVAESQPKACREQQVIRLLPWHRVAEVIIAGGAYMPPFGMYAIMAPRSDIPGASAHSNPIARRSHTSQNDVCATRLLDFRALSPETRCITRVD
jgi:hypothetical protein